MPKLTECAKYALCQFFVTTDTSEEDTYNFFRSSIYSLTIT